MGAASNQAVSDAGNQSPLKGAALALLVQRPSYGYELANLLERQLGPSWSVLRSSLYRMLGKLRAEGLISFESQEENPARIMYRATDLAESALLVWMESPLHAEDARLHLEARMIVAREQDLPRLIVALNDHERTLFARRAEIQDGLPPRKSLRAAMMFLVREAAIQQINGELVWVDVSRQTISALIAA